MKFKRRSCKVKLNDKSNKSIKVSVISNTAITLFFKLSLDREIFVFNLEWQEDVFATKKKGIPKQLRIERKNIAIKMKVER